MNPFQSRLSPLFFFFLAIAVFIVSMVVAPEYSSFTAIAIKLALVVAAGVAYDVFVLRNSDTFTEIIVNRNVAYALHLGAVYIAFGLAVGAL